MLTLLLLAILFIALFCVYFYFANKRFVGRYNASIPISANHAYQQLSHLESWPAWLPWLIYDQEASIHYSEHSHNRSMEQSLTWQGQLIKHGHLTIHPTRPDTTYFHTTLNAPAFYPCDIYFNIDFAKQEKSSTITIQLTGKLPILKRWRAKHYQLKASKDAELAILYLCDLLTKASARYSQYYNAPSFHYLARTQLNNIDAVTRPFDVGSQPMSQKMEQGFHDLFTQLGPENPPAGPCFALYKKADIIHHYFTGRLGIPVQNIVPCQLCPEKITFSGDYLHLRYVGSYQKLSLAWHVLYNYMRLNRLHVHSRRCGIEIFEVGPTQAENSQDFVTLVYLPIR
ncbi:GyrI-like domain-containing protein [Marinomonas sp. C2222]|uniref:GyrI-like domain-containing protein n=1 Tax=Marinomonas sargassi TaxID=2984494 RepID=A0ABT2YUS5_9GAMM|nr:GyrI-like domain-containing protein [Marinomonas sargassi]MCV2403639.1 GyrI-like domain-containing protein [Marinomonas sargassi]